MEVEEESDAVSTVLDAPKTKKFRFNARQIGLTYSQVPESWTHETVLELLKSLGDLRAYVVAKELHQDGGKHFHAYGKYTSPLDRTKADFADIDGFHPNILKPSKKWIDYCMKEDDAVHHGVMFNSWRNFRRDWDDFQAWKRHKASARLQEIAWPINVFEHIQTEPNESTKRCNWLIIGPPDSGKTRWFEDTFEGKQVFKVVDKRYPFDGYDGQTVLLWDDSFPKRKDLIGATGFFKTQTLVGETRYSRVYWPLKQRRMCIIMHNEAPSYADEAWFMARFNRVDVYTSV